MEPRNVVYGLAGPDGTVKYIGATSSTVRYRVNNHRSAAKAGHPAPVNEWIRNVGLHDFTGVLIEEVPDGVSIEERRDHWIEAFKRNGKPLLNCSEEEHRDRTREALKREDVREKMRGVARPHTKTPEWRAFISEVNKGRVISEEHRKIISQTHKGKVVSAETRAKIAEKARGHKRNLGRVQSPEAREKMSVTKHIRNHVEKGVVKPGCRHCEN